jgi:PLP dependent protein
MSQPTDEQIADNVSSVRQRMADACRRAGRAPGEVLLVAVTKTVPADALRSAWSLGSRDFGENRVQEARVKMAELRDLPIFWHMIGHLQGNKAGQAVDMFQMIQSIDSVDLARQVSARAVRHARLTPVLLEVNVSAEESKSGFRATAGGTDAFVAAAREIASLPGMDVWGLMTVAPMVSDPEMVRPHFRRLRDLRDELRTGVPGCAWRHLSMGMSDDFEVAIEEGATIVRLGRAIFGPRPAV